MNMRIGKLVKYGVLVVAGTFSRIDLFFAGPPDPIPDGTALKRLCSGLERQPQQSQPQQQVTQMRPLVASTTAAPPGVATEHICTMQACSLVASAAQSRGLD